MSVLDLYSPEEASRLMRNQVSPHTLRRLARENKIDCVRGERSKILFTTAHLERLIESWTKRADSHRVEASGVTLAFQGTARSRKARGA